MSPGGHWPYDLMTDQRSEDSGLQRPPQDADLEI